MTNLTPDTIRELREVVKDAKSRRCLATALWYRVSPHLPALLDAAEVAAKDPRPEHVERAREVYLRMRDEWRQGVERDEMLQVLAQALADQEAEGYEHGREEEREECAKVCEVRALVSGCATAKANYRHAEARRCARAIRERTKST